MTADWMGDEENSQKKGYQQLGYAPLLHRGLLALGDVALGKRTLVTGGTGFVGTHLVKQMRREGRLVRVLARKTSDLTSFEGLGIEVTYGDILDSSSLAGTCKNVDYVVHLAAQVDRPGIRKEQYELTNFSGTMNLVDDAIANKIKKFIFVSSIAAMGVRNIGKVTENDPCRPNTDYGESKLRIEEALITKHREMGFPVIIIRPPTVFGEGERGNLLRMTRQIKHGPYFIIGNGNNKLPFCHIDNLVQAIILSLDRGEAGQIYLVADEWPHTIQEISDLIASLVDVRITRFHAPAWLAFPAACALTFLGSTFHFDPPLFPSRVTSLSSDFYFDITKARRELGYRPAGDFAANLKQTIVWYEKNRFL